MQFYSDFEAEQPIFPHVSLTSHSPQVLHHSLCNGGAEGLPSTLGWQDTSGGLRAPTSTTRPRHPAAPRAGSVAGEAGKPPPPLHPPHSAWRRATLKMAPSRTQDGADGRRGGRGGGGGVCRGVWRALKMAPGAAKGRWRPPRRRGAARHAPRRDVPCVRGAR